MQPKQHAIERLPIKGALVISKSDAAERQLCTAIWLWFHDFDPVPVHGLACAAFKILWKLHDRHNTGHKTMRELILDRVRPEYRAGFIEVLNETENFIKHADRDPYSFHSFKPEMTEFVLMDGISALYALNGRNPIEAIAFRTWFAIHHPDLIVLEDSQRRLVDNARAAGGKLGKPQFYDLSVRANDHLRATQSKAARTKWPID